MLKVTMFFVNMFSDVKLEQIHSESSSVASSHSNGIDPKDNTAWWIRPDSFSPSTAQNCYSSSISICQHILRQRMEETCGCCGWMEQNIIIRDNCLLSNEVIIRWICSDLSWCDAVYFAMCTSVWLIDFFAASRNWCDWDVHLDCSRVAYTCKYVYSMPVIDFIWSVSVWSLAVIGRAVTT